MIESPFSHPTHPGPVVWSEESSHCALFNFTPEHSNIQSTDWIGESGHRGAPPFTSIALFITIHPPIYCSAGLDLGKRPLRRVPFWRLCRPYPIFLTHHGTLLDLGKWPQYVSLSKFMHYTALLWLGLPSTPHSIIPHFFPGKLLLPVPVILHKGSATTGVWESGHCGAPPPMWSSGPELQAMIRSVGCKVVWRECWESWWSLPLPSCVSFPSFPPLGSSFSFVAFEVFDLMCRYLFETS